MLEKLDCCCTGHLFPLNVYIPLADFKHFCFDRTEILFPEPVVGSNIIIESLLYRGACAEFASWKELFNGLGHDMA